MKIVNYSNSRLYSGNRPYADIVLAAGRRPTYKALVDTGADYLQLPAAAAWLAGISLVGRASHAITTAGGSSPPMTLVPGVSVEVEGFSIIVDVLFSSAGTTGAFLGRQALLAAFDAGFNTTEWLW